MNTNSQGDARVRVLVVDDEPTILMMLKRILQPTGYEVQTAQSGHEALSAFQQGEWDLVTLDRSMPEMNGEETATQMRTIAPAVPIILITGFPNAVTRPELFDAVLAKPFRSVELLECVAQALAKRSRRLSGFRRIARLAASVCRSDRSRPC